jgi:hypothetical protein
MCVMTLPYGIAKFGPSCSVAASRTKEEEWKNAFSLGAARAAGGKTMVSVVFMSVSVLFVFAMSTSSSFVIS